MADLIDDSLPPSGDSADSAATGPDAASTASRDATPSVLAVVISHDPGEWFDETIESLATQDYARLDVLVIDTSGDPNLRRRVHAAIPSASILDATDTEGFSAAADAVLDADVDPAFLLFCHDDVALAADAVRLMATESLRSNCGIAGPKLVDWDHPDWLQHVGYSVDRFAVAADVVEPNEIDQEQFDAVVDVFAVPSACLMIRTGLFRTLEGFDPGILFRGEDVDLCWRAQLAGARVMVVPDARVRHRRRLEQRTGVDDVRRTRARNQLRTVAVTSSRPSLLVTLPAAALLTLGEACIALLTGRFGQVRDVTSAWSWNLRRLGEIRRRRARLRNLVRVRYADIRALQESGSVRINAFVRGQIGRDALSGARREFTSAIQTGTIRIAAVVWGLVALFVVFGSRTLIVEGVPAIGDFVVFGDSSGDLFSDWWSGWRDRDLGSPGVVASGAAVLAAVGTVLGGSLGLIRTLWILAPIVVGLVGAWRMLAVTGSRRAQIGALIAYTIVPLPWAAVATASIPGIYGYAAAPWILNGLLHAQAVAPFRTAVGPWRSLFRAGVGTGVTIGVAALFEPAVALLVVPIVGGLLLSALLTANPRGTTRLMAAGIVAAVVGAFLAIPVVMDFLAAAPTWEPFANGRDGTATDRSLADILRFAVAFDTPGPLLWALAVPLAVPLVIGRSWRFGLAVRGWSVALVSWGVTWAAAWGVLPFGLPDDALLLAPAAAAVALIAGAAVAAVEHDLRGARFGWRQALVPVSLAAVLVGALPTLAAGESGRWELPRGDFSATVPFADPGIDGSYRVLWIGDTAFLPGGGRHLAGPVAWTATLDGFATLADRGVAADDGAAPLVEEALRLALAGDTLRLGRVLGGLGVRYVVLLERLAPAPFSAGSDAIPVPAIMGDTLAAQLDLRRVEGINSAMQVYSNVEWISLRAAAPPGFDLGRESILDLARSPITGTAGVLSGSGDTVEGLVPDGAEILVAQTYEDGWGMEVDGVVAARRRSLGWATAFLPETGGTATLAYSTPWWRRAALLVQLLAFVGFAGAGLRRYLGGTR